MATMNGVPFRQWLVPSSKYSIKCPYSLKPKKITIHNTDNQMPANNEISYMRNNNNAVSYHIAIDEKEAVQGLPWNRNGWHAGDGLNGYGNRNTIGVEMCRNYDRSRRTTNLNESLRSQFNKTFQNTIKVVAQLCINLGIVANYNNIKKHQDWSGKHCPSKILNDGRWNELVDGIIKEYNRLKGGNDKVSSGGTYKVVKTVNGYSTAADAAARRNKRTTVTAGSYHVFNRSNGMVNVTARAGSPGTWINPNDNVKAIPKPKRNPRIRTGGLSDTALTLVAGWLKKEKWYWTASSSKGNNPKITTGGLGTQAMIDKFGGWLDSQNMWWELIE